jgi:uncharacterized ferritin-like protein (DUF455 family)
MNNLYFTETDDNTISELRNTFDIIDINYINPTLINNKILNNNKDTINNMLNFIYTDKNKHILIKSTDYLCNREKKVCICNINADNFRKIYEGRNYKENTNYIAWIE